MNILEQIIGRKRQEVIERKSCVSVSDLEKSNFFSSGCRSLGKSLLQDGSAGIIAEFKRRSPSAGIINNDSVPSETGISYQNAGACAVSVLTDHDFFGGSYADLTDIRRSIELPVLRKEFIIDEYQVIESKSIGADAILLITGIIPAKQLDSFFRLAASLGMEVLVEIHEERDISSVPAGAALVGINNRNLSDFRVDRSSAARLVELLPSSLTKIAESGIKSVTDYRFLRDAGFEGFLIGEHFMRNNDPGAACKSFVYAITGKS
jgi:indole-3-glycerol phosphate synthase